MPKAINAIECELVSVLPGWKPRRQIFLRRGSKGSKMSSPNAYYSCLKEMIMSVLKVDPQGLPISYNPPSLILHCFRILVIVSILSSP